MRIIPLIACCLLVAWPVRADDAIDSPMYRDPVLPTPPEVIVFPPRLTELWLQALERPESDMKCQAALTIAAAHRQGMSGLKAIAPVLLRELDRPNVTPNVRVATAQALVVLDAKEAAVSLLRSSADDQDTREIAEPALAKWAFGPARDEWLKRIASPPPHRRPVVLAMQCLAVMREERATARLRELALAADSPTLIRLEAARALGAIRRSGGEADSDTLAERQPPDVPTRVAAASLLRHHDGAEAIRRLQKFAVDPAPSVATVALTRLIEIDPKLVVPSLATVLASLDANVRSLGVDVLFREASESHIRWLGSRLGDLHPDVRIKARKYLRELAGKPEFKAWVIAAGTKALAGEWRGKEQASVLFGQLDHKPAAPRLVELINDPRGEVAIASAWALRALAMSDTLPKVLAYVQANTQPGDPSVRRKISLDSLDRQLSQLCQFLGKSRYMPADAALRAMVRPREGMGEGRAAACWALGLLHEGKTVPAVSSALIGRVQAVRPMDVEDDRVRRMAAVALGRMKAPDVIPALKEFCAGMEYTPHSVNNACGWAIEQLGGGKMLPLAPIEFPQRQWFLMPLDK